VSEQSRANILTPESRAQLSRRSTPECLPAEMTEATGAAT